MISVLDHLWPGGTWWTGFDAVWPNLLASGTLFTAGYLLGIRPHLRKIHDKLDKLHHRKEADMRTDRDY